MCGIVGCLVDEKSNVNAVNIIMEGLQRLEYRGYDSAGLALKNQDNKLHVYKKAGVIKNLADYIAPHNLQAKTAIGHTRWATHGKVNDGNAHPHYSEDLALVHNGIIENAQELKKVLQEEGYSFQSETDSEVFLVLLRKFTEKNKWPLLKATSEAFKLIKGNSCFVILDPKTDEIIALKRGAPLVAGKNTAQKNLFVSSDPYALIGFSDQVYFPEDEVICRLKRGQSEVAFFELDGEVSERYASRAQVKNYSVSEKGAYDHFMMKEIHEQPELITNLLTYYQNGEGKKDLESIWSHPFSRLHIVGCGTAWHAGLLVSQYMEKINRIPSQVVLASEFRYSDPILRKDELGLFISQSGETADTLAAQELCKKNGVNTLSIVNVENSTLYRNCHHNLLIQAGPEICVCSTKAFTLMGVTGYLFAAGMKEKKISAQTSQEISVLVERIDELLGNKAHIQKIAQEIYHRKGFLFTGRGSYFPIALEGALKLKEIAYVHAEGYAGGELKHGPIALIDESMVNVAMVGPELRDKMMSNVEEVKARRGIIVSIGPREDGGLAEISDHYISLNFSGLSNLAPLLVNVACQLLAYYIAKHKGTDIDRPRNLAKSVTVE